MLPSAQAHQWFPTARFYRNPRAAVDFSERNGTCLRTSEEPSGAEFRHKSSLAGKNDEGCVTLAGSHM
jgi:hypothetical protein